MRVLYQIQSNSTVNPPVLKFECLLRGLFLHPPAADYSFTLLRMGDGTVEYVDPSDDGSRVQLTPLHINGSSAPKKAKHQKGNQ